MRVLLTLHHHFDPNLGAPGATLALGAALEAQGCKVDYWGFERAFPGDSSWGVGHSIRFPRKTAAFLAKYAADFDVIDASTGDAWLWASRGRPGAGSGTVLVTRSHGLEHIADQQVRAEAKATGRRLSWKYPLYHGGWRLHEVAESLRRADGCLLLNDADRDYVRNVLKVPAEKLSVTAMGVASYFFERPSYNAPVSPSPQVARGEPLRLAYLSSWIPRKGSAVLAEAAGKLASAGVPFELTAFGTGSATEETVRADFPEAVRSQVKVVPRYKHTELPDLLTGLHALLFPSLSEGFSRALVEAMACGLVPVATAVGGAPSVIQEGKNGFLIAPGDVQALTRAVQNLAGLDTASLDKMRQQARETALDYRWDAIAQQTIAIYERARAARGIPASSASSAARVREEAVTR